MKKWVHNLNREFSKEEGKMISKFMRKYSISVFIKEMQIKTTLRFHLTPLRMAIFKGNNKKMLVEMRLNRNTYTLFLGMQISPTTIESSMEIS
jgi:hypothetical protein